MRELLFITMAVAVLNVDATTLSQLSFEELTDHSAVIASGHVTRMWAAWDSNHKYIWTHYEFAVSSSQKGAAASTLEFAEPGGSLDGAVMNIPGTVSYRTGQNVLVFLQRMPNGYLRTTGWGLGKYRIDSTGHLHADVSLRSADVVRAGSAATSLKNLDGMTMSEATGRIAARIRAARQPQ